MSSFLFLVFGAAVALAVAVVIGASALVLVLAFGPMLAGFGLAEWLGEPWFMTAGALIQVAAWLYLGAKRIFRDRGLLE